MVEIEMKSEWRGTEFGSLKQEGAAKRLEQGLVGYSIEDGEQHPMEIKSSMPTPRCDV